MLNSLTGFECDTGYVIRKKRVHYLCKTLMGERDIFNVKKDLMSAFFIVTGN